MIMRIQKLEIKIKKILQIKNINMLLNLQIYNFLNFMQIKYCLIVYQGPLK
jgi:hypothetical protein